MWVALQVKPKSEAAVAIHLRNKGYEEFVPTYVPEPHNRATPRIRELPLLPGYVLCKFTPATMGRLIVTTPGVIRILGIAGKPSPVSEEDIATLRQIVSSKLYCRPSAYLRVGQEVRISAGPLAGITGILTCLGKNHRVVIAVEMLR